GVAAEEQGAAADAALDVDLHRGAENIVLETSGVARRAGGFGGDRRAAEAIDFRPCLGDAEFGAVEPTAELTDGLPRIPQAQEREGPKKAGERRKCRHTFHPQLTSLCHKTTRLFCDKKFLRPNGVLNCSGYLSNSGPTWYEKIKPRECLRGRSRGV